MIFKEIVRSWLAQALPGNEVPVEEDEILTGTEEPVVSGAAVVAGGFAVDRSGTTIPLTLKAPITLMLRLTRFLSFSTTTDRAGDSGANTHQLSNGKTNRATYLRGSFIE